MKNYFLYALSISMLWAISPMQGLGQAKKKSVPEKTAEVKKDSTAKDTAKKVTIADQTKSCKKTEGFFTLFQDTATGRIKLYIRKEQLGEEFLYQSFSIGGPADLFLNQNMIRETWLFKIRKNFERLEWVRSNPNFYFDPKSPLSKAANVDVSEAIFFSEKIAAEDSLGILISADDLLLSEKLDPVKPFLPPGFPPGLILNLGTVNKDKSFYQKIRSFPSNTDVVVNLSYENLNPQNFGGLDITDARYISVKMQHSFVQLPKNNFKPRFAHPHVGYFTQEMENMTTTENPRYHDIITRWHLEKKNPNDAISEPVEPIVFWVENTTPVELRQTIMDAGHKWNEAFEKAGFKNAVVMKMMPDDAEWDPADIRYNVIRWVSSDLGFAIGPSFINPRTGQILGADITIDFGFLRGLATETDLFERMHRYINYRADQPEALEQLADQHDHRMCLAGKGLQVQRSFATAVLETLDADEEEKKNLLHQFMTELVLHEMGHTLGLSHNMKSSQMLSPKELKDKNMTGTLGVIGSVMDYSVVNVALNKAEQAHYFTTCTGPYDKWVIEYGYRPFSAAEEEEGLKRILARSTEKKLIFGNDADITRPGRGIDPRVMVWDLSNDMVAYAEERFELVNKTMRGLKEKFTKPDKTYENLNVKYYALINQRYDMTGAVANYIGGIYLDRSLPGQNSKNLPYTPVDEAYQRKAMDLLAKRVFAPDAFDAETSLYNYLQRQRRGFQFFFGSEDPKLDVHILGLQAYTLITILNSNTLRRINNTTMYGNSYDVHEVLKDLENAIFGADWKTSVNSHRKNLQNFYVTQLIGIMENKMAMFGTDTKAAVFTALNRLNKSLKDNKGKDDATKAHRDYLHYQINKVLRGK
ncbi:MAG: zinc-dependent metalloprotease [Saprospiraceae bacterium]|nr:zinc-dependent metalloprotease [Saprospiraceae bacterium]